MTSAALTVNKEWNTKLISTENGEVAEEIVEEFQRLWNSEYALPYDDFYEVYKERYNIIKHQREIAKSEEIPSLEKYRLKPNSMQERFIANLRKILEQGEERALLISATGTGKTYASAFAMRELGFKRVLFLVHRVTLAKQAKKSFEKVFDKKVTDEEFNQLTSDERLAMDEADATEEMQPLDYIFSRDILNEGLQHK